MISARSRIANLFLRYLADLRFPYLLALVVALFVIDLLVPDVIPFADELLLGLVTLLLARLKRTPTDTGTQPRPT